MRGLTPLERFLLDPSETNGSLLNRFSATEWFQGRVTLWKQSRLSSPVEGVATDLGRLALRVCPVREL